MKFLIVILGLVFMAPAFAGNGNGGNPFPNVASETPWPKFDACVAECKSDQRLKGPTYQACVQGCEYYKKHDTQQQK
jgi:hypothetical protein